MRSVDRPEEAARWPPPVRDPAARYSVSRYKAPGSASSETSMRLLLVPTVVQVPVHKSSFSILLYQRPRPMVAAPAESGARRANTTSDFASVALPYSPASTELLEIQPTNSPELTPSALSTNPR